MGKFNLFGVAAVAVAVFGQGNGQECTDACVEEAVLSEAMLRKMEQKEARFASLKPNLNPPVSRGLTTECVDGFAGIYPCKGIDLLSFTSVEELGGPRGNDIWGWVDPNTGREYSLTGQTSGTRFVDVTDPINPIILGFMNSTNNTVSSWRDIKVYQNVAYVVADRNPVHGVQVFDLTRLRANPTGELLPDYTYTNVGSAHNIFVNEDTGYAYVVGSRASCAGGLHLLNLNNNPLEPEFAGCYSEDGYTHDVQCIVYSGPDVEFQGREICFAYNEDTLTIVDVTDKELTVNNTLANAEQLARVSYPGVGYTHQGWVTEDERFLLLDDERDERVNPNNATQVTRTILFSIESLRNPEYLSVYESPVISIDHNLYVKGNLAFMSNYASGLRVNSVDGLYEDGTTLEEVAYFDTYPDDDVNAFVGLWSSYIYFPSGNMLLNNIGEGLFIVKMSDQSSSVPVAAPVTAPIAVTVPTAPVTETVPTAPVTETVPTTPATDEIEERDQGVGGLVSGVAVLVVAAVGVVAFLQYRKKDDSENQIQVSI